MTIIDEALQMGTSPQTLAQAVLTEYFKEKQVTFPINPFQILTDFGVPFVFRAFSSYEGIYIPAMNSDDLPVVGINIKRPITRQRYTAAHELCHHLKDGKNSLICDIDYKNPIEKFAEQFAAEMLMPIWELKEQVEHYSPYGEISFDDVLRISEYFGVSFLACLQRIAFILKRIDGDVSTESLRKRANIYKPDKRREELGFNHLILYEQLIDAIEANVRIEPDEFIKAKFCNEYIYNDSRLEGIDIDRSRVAEIVTDIRLHGANSQYCTETYKYEIEVAGHANMYNYIFESEIKNTPNLYTILLLHEKLYSCAPDPSYGGKFRTSNTLVIGAKFETVDFNTISTEMSNQYPIVNALVENRNKLTLSKYLEKVIQLHHKLTVIHPFGDGNGRSTRGFINVLLLYRGIIPVYIRIEDKSLYLEALKKADSSGIYTSLYILFFKALLQMQAELTKPTISLTYD